MLKLWHVHGVVSVGQSERGAAFSLTLEADNDDQAQALAFDLLCNLDRAEIVADIHEIERAEGYA